MSSDFLVWRQGTMKDGICKLNGITGIPDDGKPELANWSKDASAKMDPKFPKDKGFADSLYGTGFLVISDKARDFLYGENIKNIEYLPIKIVNHNGNVEPVSYFIVNPFDVVDCIDQDASNVDFDPFDKKSISGCEQLVLNTDVIPSDLKIFRLENWKSRIIIRADLANRMKQAGLTGMKFINPDDYDGLI